MARRTTTVDDDEFEEHVIDVDVSDEMQTSFLEYAYSVIYARALPDARDGLKPVQRRILFSMHEMGLRPDRPHVKCARVVGEVMGKYHPHGDTAIYDALVRLGQPWAMRLPLVDSHGNFGSLDAGPAAMRYTECRMAPPAMAIAQDLELDTVDFKPNYDGHEQEPAVMPAAFPHMLVNGATGIAVGMATNIPPHNLVETVAALRHLLVHPDADLAAIMRFIPGPDFASGGTIIGLDGIRDAYETGRGSFRVRAKSTIEQITARRKGIVVTELPTMIGPERIMEQIKTLVQSKKLQGIADLKDLSDLQNPTRLVIEIKNGFNPEAILAQLYKKTKLEDSFGINMVALVDGQPRTLGLLEALHVYLEHRLQVTLRRAMFQRTRAEERLHLVEGLLIAILDIDDVIAIIRGSDDASQARAKLIEAFELSETQANYILDMQLRRLTKFSRLELEAERDDLRERIAALTEIIESDEALRAVVSKELAEVSELYGDARRTVLLSSDGAASTTAAPLEVRDDPCWVLASATGLVARTTSDHDMSGDGPRASHDVLAAVVRTSARSEIGVVTSAGRLVRLAVVDLPTLADSAAAPNLQGGSKVSELIELGPEEQVRALVPLREDSPGLAVGTRRGIIKVVRPEILSKPEWEIIRLDEGDEVVGAVWLDALAEADACFVTESAHLLRFPISLVRAQGRTGGGVAGIKLTPDDVVVFFGVVPHEDAVVVTIAGQGDGLPGVDTSSVKVTRFDAFPAKGRATMGVRAHRLARGETGLQLAWAGPAPAIASTARGKALKLPEADTRRDGGGSPASGAIACLGSRAPRTGAPVANDSDSGAAEATAQE